MVQRQKKKMGKKGPKNFVSRLSENFECENIFFSQLNF